MNFVGDPKSSRPISLLCVSYKILERLIYARVEPLIDPLLRRLKNGVPHGSVLAPLLFNIYTYDLPSMISRKFAYAHNLAL